MNRSPEESSKSAELYFVRTKILISYGYCFVWLFVATHSVCTVFLLGAGIINKWCPKINQITNRRWISEAVGNKYRKSREYLCFWKHVMPKGTFTCHGITLLSLHAPTCYEQNSVWFMYLICNNLLRSVSYNLWMSIQFDIMSC